VVQVLCGFAELLLRRRQLITFDVHLLLILFYEVVGAQRVCVRIQEQLCRLLLDLSLGLVDPLNVGKEFGSVQAGKSARAPLYIEAIHDPLVVR